MYEHLSDEQIGRWAEKAARDRSESVSWSSSTVRKMMEEIIVLRAEKENAESLAAAKMDASVTKETP